MNRKYEPNGSEPEKSEEGIVTDDDSRWKLIEALARDLTAAATKLARNANGD